MKERQRLGERGRKKRSGLLGKASHPVLTWSFAKEKTGLGGGVGEGYLARNLESRGRAESIPEARLA